MLYNTIGKAEDLFKSNMELFHKEFYGILSAELSKFSNRNKLEFDSELLAKLKKAIDFSFDKTGYKKYVEAYLSVLDEIDEDNIRIHLKTNKLRLENLIINNDVLKELRNQTIQGLTDKNIIDVRFKKPIEKIMRIDVLRGLTYKEAQEHLRIELVQDESMKKTKTNSYLETITKDALSQYDGAINDEARKEFKLNTMIYIGSAIETTRPICRHLLTKSRWSKDELLKVLDKYCPNGEPSEEREIVKIKGKEVSIKIGSGIIEGTNEFNFTINRGGHGCRHQVRWIR